MTPSTFASNADVDRSSGFAPMTIEAQIPSAPFSSFRPNQGADGSNTNTVEFLLSSSTALAIWVVDRSQVAGTLAPVTGDGDNDATAGDTLATSQALQVRI